jgi:hypothetical protein
MSWLKEEGFGGIMIWSVDMDDFKGSCGTGKYPLMNAMRQELDGYTVKLQYDGPYESSRPANSQYTTKDREYWSLYTSLVLVFVKEGVLAGSSLMLTGSV